MKAIKYMLFIVLLILSGVCKLNAQKYEIDWSSYYSGELTEICAVVYDSLNKCVYFAGTTADSVGIATPDSHKDNIGYIATPLIPMILSYWKTDVFLAKFDLEGNRIWGTYVGGEGRDFLIDMTIDRWGNIYLSGGSGSVEGIATLGTHRSEKLIADSVNRFVMKFSSSGDRIWGTYYGEDSFNLTTIPLSLATDTLGNVYVAGTGLITEPILSTPSSYQPDLYGSSDGLIIKFDSTGNRVWATYLGGSNIEQLRDITVSSNGNLYVTGTTKSYNRIGTEGTYQSMPSIDEDYEHVSSITNGFISKFTLDGELVWGTYISVSDASAYNNSISPVSLVTDAENHVYIYGTARCNDGVGTPGVYQQYWAHADIEFKSTDMFLMKFDSTGNRLWGTYIGGEGRENENYGSILNFSSRSSIRLLPDEDAVIVTGATLSTSGMPNDCGYEDYINTKGFMACIRSNNGTLRWGNYYEDCMTDIAIIYDNQGSESYSILGVGKTIYDGIATPSSHKDNKDGLVNSAFIVKFIEDECAEFGDLILTLDYPILTAESGYSEYKWYHNDELMHVSEENTWNISDTVGFYYVIAYKECCYFTSDTLKFETTGLEEIHYSQLNVYPNPVSNQLIIELPKDIQNYDVEIYNIFGIMIYSERFSTHSTDYLKLDVDILDAGMYFVRIVHNDRFFISKFLKQ